MARPSTGPGPAEVDDAATKARGVDPPPVETELAQGEPVEPVDPDIGDDAFGKGAFEAAPDPSSGDLFARGSAEETAEGGGSIIDPGLLERGGSGLGPDPGTWLEANLGSPDIDGGVTPAGTDGLYGTGRGMSIPDVSERGPTRPDTPGLDEARSSTRQSSNTVWLDDGSSATHIVNPRFEGGDAWIVETPAGDILEDQAALDHIGEHLPLVAPPTEDMAEPEADPEWQQRMADSAEEHTHYGEIRMDALKGSEVNPDPMSDGIVDETLDSTMDPSSPDFADPFDGPLESADTIDPADLDPGTIDPIDID